MGHWAFEVLTGRLSGLFSIPHLRRTRVAEWLTRYSGAQRAALELAQKELVSKGLASHALNHSSMFVKREVSCWCYGSEPAVEIKPRVIIDCDPRIKVALGPTIVSATKSLHEKWHSHFPIYFECGSTQDEVAEWFNRNLAKFGTESLFASDFSKMDRHQSAGSMRMMRTLLEKAGVHGLARLCLEGQERKQVVRTREGARVTTAGFLRSGVPNTTLYNSIANAALHAYAFIKNGAVPGRDFVFMVRGDDNLAFVRPGFDKGIVELAKKLGFALKVQRPASVAQVRFCSNAFYPTREGYVPAPTIGKCLPKLSFTAATVRKGFEMQHMRGVALGLLALTNHVPLLGDFIQQILKITVGKISKETHAAVRQSQIKYMVGSRHEPVPDSDLFIQEMYAISADDISFLRHSISSMGPSGTWGGARMAELVGRMLQVEKG
jgi:hypothetical protein